MTVSSRFANLTVALASFAALSLAVACRGRADAAEPRPSSQAASQVVGIGRVVPGQRVLHLAAPTADGGINRVVASLQVARGDQVHPGQVLAVLADHKALAATLAQADRAVEVASRLLAQARAGEKAGTLAAQQAQVASAQAGLLNAGSDQARIHALFDQGIVPRAQVDQADMVLAQARERLQEAQGQYRSMQDIRPVDLAVLTSRLSAAVAARDKAKADLDNAEIRAPLAGQVLEINAYPGEAIGPQGLLDLGDTGHMMVEGEVDVLDIARIRLGGRVVITGDGLPLNASGRVVEIFASVSANEILDSHPLANADRRVVRVRVRPDDARPFQGLVNTLVRLGFLP